MKFVLTVFLPLVLFVACKTNAPVEHSTPSDPQINPGSCKIEASVVEVLTPTSPDTNDVCFKNSCEVIVHVNRIMQCGSSATVTPNEKGEILVHFPNSINPAVKDSHSTDSKQELKKGSLFSAIVETRQGLWGVTNYVVYYYEIR